MGNGQPNFQLFTSLRFDTLLLQSPENTALAPGPSPFYMLSYHRDRILHAATYFKWTEAITSLSGPEGLRRLLENLEAAIDLKSTTPLRIRIILNSKGEIMVETSETTRVPLGNLFPTCIPSPRAVGVKSPPLVEAALVPHEQQAWTIVVDPMRTKPSPFTSYKTTCRDMYMEARDRVGIKTMTEPQEVLIISERGEEIMEGSLTSVFFWRNGRWVTPPAASGGQVGTSRRWLLEKGLCEEEVTTAQSLVDGEECWISNGVRGLSWGKIRL